MLSRLNQDVLIIQNGTSDKLGMGFYYGTQMIVGVIIAFCKSWQLTLVILSITPLLALSGMFMTKKLASSTKESQKLSGSPAQIAEEVLSGYKTVLSFVRTKYESDRYYAGCERVRKSTVKKGVVQALMFGLSQFVIFGTYALSFGYGGKLVLDGTLNVGDMMVVFISIMYAALGVGQFAQLSPDYAKAKGAAVKIFETIDATPKIGWNESGGKMPVLSGNVEFRSVQFAYPTRPDVMVLNKVDLVFPAGKKIALVGQSGCGKSTTVQLLERFYLPAAGQILVDGVDISTLDLAWFREHVGLVSQEPTLFGTTIEENIRYGRLDATAEEIETAAKLANAYGFIVNLPEGFKTQVGERGTQLSGGQKQRIAIARALLKNPRILLLDEATSALDSESEVLVQEALDRLMVGRTSIVIAHRLSTIKDADLIYVLNKGLVLESGTHDSLVARSGAYFKLVTRQMQQSVNDL